MLKKIILLSLFAFLANCILLAKISDTIEQFNNDISEPYFLKFDNKVTDKFTTYGYKKNGIQVFLTVNKDQKIIQEMIIVDDTQYGLYLMNDGYPTSKDYRAKYSILIAVRAVFKDAVCGYIQDGTIDGLSLESVTDEVYDSACYGEQYNRTINGIKITSKMINRIVTIGIELISAYD
ncbi:MAG: hypothetical protein ISS80_02625 [Candidatus Cloacimonetes bacterium]|nr:hypothetical protein [Candidatus Cloacimonadota bacterium]MBL7148946.1 hypothetical protein [Candidatus Cloacimonadota bacterium]